MNSETYAITKVHWSDADFQGLICIGISYIRHGET